MVDQGHLIRLASAEDGDAILALVLRRFNDSQTEDQFLVAEISDTKPAREELGIAILETSHIHLDRLRTITSADIDESLDQLSPKDFAEVRTRWQMLTFPDAPATGEHLPFAVPDITGAEIASVLDTLASGWLTTGPKAAKLETDFASAIGCAHAIAVNSCTSGLHLALEAIGVGPGDRVITTPNTFTASAEVIRYLGADPLFVDIDPDTLNLDPRAVAEALDNAGHGVKAIMPVHFAGQACDMDPLLALAKDHDIKIVEDAAHAFPASYKGRNIGTLGDVTVYSFYATKTLTTGEGGMVVTEDEALAKRMRVMRLHGIDRDVFDRYASDKPAWYYEVVAPGFKYNMPDIAAAIGIEQLRRADDLRARRQQIAEAYNEAFKDLPLKVPFVARPEDTHAWHLYVIRLALEELDIDRNRFIELMSEAGVGTSVHFIPLHIQPYWRDQYQLRPESLPVALDVYQRSVSLPIHTRMTDADVTRVIDAVRKIAHEHS